MRTWRGETPHVPTDRSPSVPLRQVKPFCQVALMQQTLAGNCLRGVKGYNVDDFDLLLSLSPKGKKKQWTEALHIVEAVYKTVT